MVFFASWHSLFAWIICSRPDAKQVTWSTLQKVPRAHTACTHALAAPCVRQQHALGEDASMAPFVRRSICFGVLALHLRVFDVEDLRVLQHHVVNFRLKAQFRDLSARANTPVRHSVVLLLHLADGESLVGAAASLAAWREDGDETVPC